MPKRTKQTTSKNIKSTTNKTLSSCCKFLKQNWHIIAGVTILVAIITIIIVQCIQSRKQEMFTDDDESPTMVMFHVPWCGYCKKTMPVWKELQSAGVLNSKNNSVKILDIDCEEDKAIAKKHGVDGFPTIKYFPNGLNKTGSAITYENERDLPTLKTFINSQ